CAGKKIADRLTKFSRVEVMNLSLDLLVYYLELKFDIMSLNEYNEKRDFSQSSEPQGREKKGEGKSVFVVQRHKASRLHYDFRIEVNGVLKSWAVPKGPSLNPAEKRLAMMVEDHPYDYKDFEGEIPEGNYGAGIVEIWDHGYYTGFEEASKEATEDKVEAQIEKGDVKIKLFGNKLQGEFALVKTRNSYQENGWLLIKHKDEYAVSVPYSAEKETDPESPINRWLKENKKAPAKKAVVNKS
ncbi:MAG TPA: DNA polymerase ligase N-terminal domain-containing protein, partial [Bacteroidales bacterium]|nr:DNA polymerase ligase N-terminal domain-containing protein [Bacteroidales bacterium]